jgi:hypothetical protein
VTFTQVANIWHSDTASDDDAETLTVSGGTLTAVQTLTDADGDTDTAELDLSAGVFTIEDDGPTLSGSVEALEVHEDALDNYNPGVVLPGIQGSKGNPEGSQQTTAVLTFAMLMALVDFGTDGFGSFALAGTSQLADGSPVLLTDGVTQVTSKGLNVEFDIVDSTHINGVATDGRIIFTIELDVGAETITITLVDQVDHLTSLGDDAVLEIDLSPTIIATDADGDSIQLANAVTLNVENDVPVDFTPEYGYLTNTAIVGNSDAQTFELFFADAVGADEPGSVIFANIVSGVSLLKDANGDNVTSGGETITLVLDVTGKILTGYADYGGANTKVLTVTINSDDTYTVDLDALLDNGAVDASFTPGGLATQSGNPGLNSVVVTNQDLNGDGTNDPFEVLFSGIHNFDGTPTFGSVNISNNSGGGIGVSSQTIAAGRTLLMDFASDFNVITPGSDAAFTVSDQLGLNAAAFSISQVNPTGGDVVVKLRAYDVDLETNFGGTTPNGANSSSDNDFDIDVAADRNIFLGGSIANLTKIAINGVEYDISAVTDADPLNGLGNGETINVSGHNITVYYADGNSDTFVDTVYFDGAKVGDSLGVVSDTSFSRLAVTNGSGEVVPGSSPSSTFSGDNFDVGGISFRTDEQAGNPIDLSLDIQGVDADGDTVSSSIDFTVVPDDSDNIVGTDGPDLALTGNGNDNLIAGLAGDDTLSGLGGDDILAGGLGSDTMTGGAGADTFVIDTDSLGVGIEDVIVDYSGADGDEIDLSQLLQGAFGSGLDGADGSSYVYVNRNVGDTDPNDGNGVEGDLIVDVNGHAGFGGGATVANIQNAATEATITILFDDGAGGTGSDTV